MSITRHNPGEGLKPGQNPQPVHSGNYTQVNILFPSEQVELPSAEKLKAFPPEAQNAILAAFDREQIERHAWLKNQQSYEHKFNLQSESHYFVWRMTGTVFGGIALLSLVLCGTWLVVKGSSAIGVGMMVTAFAGLAGSALYGQKAASTPRSQRPSSTKEDHSEESLSRVSDRDAAG